MLNLKCSIWLLDRSKQRALRRRPPSVPFLFRASGKGTDTMTMLSWKIWENWIFHQENGTPGSKWMRVYAKGSGTFDGTDFRLPYFSSLSMVAISVPFPEARNRKGTESGLLWPTLCQCHDISPKVGWKWKWCIGPGPFNWFRFMVWLVPPKVRSSQ